MRGLTMPSPSRVGRWTVVRELGRGYFATVYLVHSDDIQGALKLCLDSNPAASERLELEERALTTLVHPNIPKLLDHGTAGPLPYLVMEFADGVSIKETVVHNQAAGRVYGDLEASRLLAQLLDALAEVHKAGLVHRDIKDANIIHDRLPSSLRLIDFGFCKETGASAMRSDDSFWRVGSARFSPPSKLSRPALADPSHDIFAVGVVAYRMLTGRYPWFVGRSDDFDALRRLQLGQPLIPVNEINSYVLPEISTWVSRLLELDDRRRPSAVDSHDRLMAILQKLEPSDTYRRGVITTQYPEVIRDPVHGDVRLTAYEYRILQSPEMQRLRSIKQLGFTDMVYPGASHSRLSHSIGSVARVEQILHTIEDTEGIRLDSDLRLASRLYALAHDVLHIAFGHTLEDELGLFVRHDLNVARRARLVEHEGSGIGAVLREASIGRSLIPYLAGEALQPGHAILADLVSGVSGADVLDYINRDAFYCGLDHRIDSAIFRQFRLHSLAQLEDRRLVSFIGGKYGIRIDREYAVETILKERYAMFLKVYTHPTKAAASALLGKVLTSVMAQPTGRRQMREEDIEWMGDEVLIDRLRNLAKGAAKAAADRLYSRRLPKAVYRGVMLGETERDETSYRNRRLWLAERRLVKAQEREAVEGELASVVGLDPYQVIVYCPQKAPGHQQVEHWVTTTRNESAPRQGSAFGAEFARRHLGLWEFWVFVVGVDDERKRTSLADVVQDRFGMPNMIDIDRLQGRLF
jgi:uncharacterized protein